MESQSLSLNKVNKKTADNTAERSKIKEESVDISNNKKPKKSKKLSEDISGIDKSPGKKKKKLKWAKEWVEIVEIKSYKEYNLENCHEEPYTKEKIRCSCKIF